MKRSEIKRRPLSDTTLAALEPEAKEYREADTGRLHFRVKPEGTKSWQWRYKKPNGQWTWLGLGGYPAVSAKVARQKAAQLLADEAEGKNPAVSRQARKVAELEAAGQTFEALALEWFNTRRAGWEPRTADRTLAALRLHVFPVVGQRPYTDIHPMEWMQLMQSMERRGILEQMRNVRRYCRDAYDLARVTGRITHNPLDGLHKFLRTRPSDSYAHVPADELPELLRAIAAYPHSHIVRLGLRLLALTSVRPSELREALWSEFDLSAAVWSIPAARMKMRRDHVVPLSRQALDALAELHTLSGGQSLLFPGRTDRTKPISNMSFNMALRRMGYQGRQTGHGFRHIASTTLREHGFPKDHVEAQLAHVEGGVSGVYNKAQYLEQRRHMMQWYADHLDKLAAGNVVQGQFGQAVNR